MAIFNRIKFDGLRSRNWIVYKHPTDQIITGSVLIVGEGQAAIFVRGGQICDIFEAGTYKLTTENLPILSSLINLPFGGQTPFTAEIFYVNKTARLNMNWGTSDPIPLIDPKYFVKVRVRAFGQFGIRINDYEVFFQQLIGAMGMGEIVDYNAVTEFYKGLLVTRLKTLIADEIINEKISVLEISAKLDEISATAKEVICQEFEEFGLEVLNFFIQSINFPEEDFNQISKLLEDRAAFEIMGDSRYATKRSFDIYEGAANNEGGISGAFAAGGIGLAAGVNMMNNASGVMRQSISSPVQEKKICPGCQQKVPSDSKFCSHCGMNLQSRVCECGNVLQPGTKFCSECGKKVD